MTKSQGAIRSVRSLVFFASSVMTTPSITHFLGRSNKPKEQAPRPHLVLKPSKKKFRLFRSRIKRSSKISVCDSTTSIDDDDDDCSSTYSEYDVSAPSSSVPNLLVEYKHRSIQEETLQEEDEDLVKTDQDSSKEDDDWNWDSQSESGCLETSNDDHLKRCSAPIPITAPPNKRRHHRAISLPQNLIKDLPKSLYHRQPTPSESWDNDFELSEDFKVPSKVEESQVYIRMDMFNIQDFRTQIEELKNLRSKKLTLASKVQSSLSLQKPGNCAARRNLKIFKNLEEMYKTEWEEANVIIDISDMAQDRESKLDGGKSVGRGVSQTPSERHMHVLRKIIDEKSRDDDDDDDIVDVAIDDDDNDAFIVGPLDDDDKENDTTNFVFPPRTSTPKNESSAEPSSSRGILEKTTQSLIDGWNFHGLKRDHSGLVSSSQSSIAKKKRRENVRISVDEMPSLIDHLRILQSRLLGHVVQLADLTALRSESSFSPNIFQRKLY